MATATGTSVNNVYGYSDRDICQLTDHNTENPLNNYDSGNSLDKKAVMANILLLGNKRK